MYIESGQKHQEQKLEKNYSPAKDPFSALIESEKKSSQRNENKNGLDANDILFNVKLVQNILNQIENKINNIQKKNKELSNKNKDIESQFISIIQSNEI